MPTLDAAVLAAGKSTRMKSKMIKVLHPIAGVPIIRYILSTVATIEPAHVVMVIGRDGQQVKDEIGPGPLYVEQTELLGTGHALLQARPLLDGHCDTVLCLYGDMPLIRAETLRRLIATHRSARAVMTLLTVGGEDSMGFGHIVRDAEGHVQAIVEE